jgi:hypothetical protein
LKPGFFKNEDLAKISCEGRLLFAGLWGLADREGRLEDRPSRIRAELFPYQPINVDRLLQELAAAGFIRRYVVDQRACVCIPTFRDHQQPHLREAPSILPPPPEHWTSTGLAPDQHRTSPPVLVLDPVTVSDPVSKPKKEQRADAQIAPCGNVENSVPPHAVLEKLAHGVLDDRDRGDLTNLTSELAAELKQRAARARIAYDGRAIAKALESAHVQRGRRR